MPDIHIDVTVVSRESCPLCLLFIAIRRPREFFSQQAAFLLESMPSFAANAASRTLWSRLKLIPVTYPFAFGVVLSGCKTSFSDLLVQKVVEQREKVDWKRNAAFASFGFFYLGGVQYAIYVNLFSRLFPGAAAFAAKPIREKLKDHKGLFQVSPL